MQEVNESIIKKANELQFESSVLRNSIKRGVYKELYKKHLLTVAQLNALLALLR